MCGVRSCELLGDTINIVFARVSEMYTHIIAALTHEGYSSQCVL